MSINLVDQLANLKKELFRQKVGGKHYIYTKDPSNFLAFQDIDSFSLNIEDRHQTIEKSITKNPSKTSINQNGLKESRPRIHKQAANSEFVPTNELKERAFSIGKLELNSIIFIRICPSTDEIKDNKPYSDFSGQVIHKIISGLKLDNDIFFLTYLLSRYFNVVHDNSVALKTEINRFSQMVKLRRPAGIVVFGERMTKWMLNNSNSLEYYQKLNNYPLFQNTPILPLHDPRYFAKIEDLKKVTWRRIKHFINQIHK